ncbi:MAG: hypothetical protein ABI594_18550 [Ginsengibacter sp.]
MKKLLVLFTLLTPVLLSAQQTAPKKNKTTVIVLHPIPTDRDAFEQGLAQHDKQFHTGEGPVDIYEVLTGNHTGEYHFVYRNPASWTDIETAFNAVDQKSHSGWASFEPDPNAEWPKLFKAAFPKEDFKAWIKKFNGTQKSFESMVVKHRTDLSSPM